MKYLSLVAASIAALTFVHTAPAQTVVRITGSTAFRAAASNAIKNVFTASGNSLVGYAYDGTNFTGATYQVFQGSIGANSYIVKTNWSGSVEGIRDVSLANSIQFLGDPGTGASQQPISLGGTTGANVFVSQIPGVCLADNRQTSTPYKTPTLSGGAVGIVPFAFVASKSCPASVTNLTALAMRQLLTAGTARQTYFDASGSISPVYAIGRYFGSGTRLSALAEIGYGTQNLVVQLHPTVLDGTNKVSHINAYTDPADPDNVGNYGETSGGSLADALRYDTTNALIDDSTLTTGGAGFFVGYLGEADSYRACYTAFATNIGTNTGDAKYLSYNGVSAFFGTAYKNQSGTTNTSNGTVVVTGDVSGATVGAIVTGTGIASGAVISAISTFSGGVTTLTLDKTGTATGTATNIQIGALHPGLLRNGAYTFWNFEQFLWNTTQVPNGSLANTFVTTLQTQIKTVDYVASGVADDAAFKVTRDFDGGPVHPNGR